MPNDVTWQSTGPLPQCWFGRSVLPVTSLLPCSVFMLQFPRIQSTIFQICFFFSPLFLPFFFLFFLFFHRLKSHSEWVILTVWMAYQCNFSKHTSQILLLPSKDPQRNISIEECLYFASIVHLLWQTSKRRISALLNAIYYGTRYFDETSSVLSPRLSSAERKTAEKL